MLKDTVLFITEGSDAISLVITEKVAVNIQEKVGKQLTSIFRI